MDVFRFPLNDPRFENRPMMPEIPKKESIDEESIRVLKE